MKLVAIVVAAFVVFIPQMVDGQFGMGINIGSVNWLSTQGVTEDGNAASINSPATGFAYGLEVFYTVKPRIRVNLRMDAVSTLDSNTYSNNGSSDNDTKVNNSGAMLHMEMQYALYHNFFDKGFTIYALAGFAVNTYFYRSKYTEHYPGRPGSTAHTFYGQEQTRTYNSVSVSVGMGMEHAFNYSTHVFLDVRLCPGQSTKFNSGKIQQNDFLPDNFNPSYVVAAIGLRLNLAEPKEVQ
jgi:hypothetical protein